MKILLQTTSKERDTMKDLLAIMTNLCQKIEKIETDVQNLKANSQQHDSKNAELRRSADEKQLELKGDVGKLLKTHDITDVAGTSKGAMEKPTPENTNLNSVFTKPFTSKVQIIDTSAPQTSTYAASLHKEKKTYNNISRTYIENQYKIQNFLNQKPKSTTTLKKTHAYLTQKHKVITS